MVKNRVNNLRIIMIFLSVLGLLFIRGALFVADGQIIDILLKGGHVIDPKNNIDERMDIAITDGKISQVAKEIPEKNAKRVAEVSGMYVTPGLIDMHVHAFHGTDPASYIADGWDAKI